MIEIDIVIPIYNSSAFCEKLVFTIEDWKKESQFNPHVIFVNDGSIDDVERALIQVLKQVTYSWQLIRLAKNYGQHTATAVGFHLSTREIIATIDDDLQHDLYSINKMYNCLIAEDADLVYGNYFIKKHHVFRNFGANILKKILNTENKDYAIVTSCRLMKKNVVQIFKENQRKIHFVDDYLLLSSYKKSTCLVDHNKREFGESGYSTFRLIKMAFSILLLHSSLPLKIITRMGLVISLFCFFIGTYYIYQKLFFSVAIGFTSIIVAIFFSTGIILFSLGIIGEYIRRIWIAKQNLDQVLISKIY
jgi:glycosyltransferase involved in cell wall biosynthesis